MVWVKKTGMKKCLAAICAAAVLTASCGSLVVTAEEPGLIITSPSAAETTMTPTRDFYVTGSFAEQSEAVNVVVTVEKNGQVLRRVESDVDSGLKITPADHVFTAYTGGFIGRGTVPITEQPPADLIYDPDVLNSFFETYNKCSVFKRKGKMEFAALIFGGCTKDFDTNYQDKSGKPLADLTAGDYRVKAVLISEGTGAVVETANLDVTMGTVKDKMNSRFSPSSAYEKMSGLAKEKGYRVYNDSFPGYWSGYDNYYEIGVRWRRNNQLEYASGQVHSVMYNVKETSATNSVELGKMIETGRTGTDDVTFYHYDIGEPYVLEQSGKKEGTLVRFAKADTMDFVRAEIYDADTAENHYIVDNAEKTVDYDLKDGVKLDKGETLSLFGAVTPIAKASEVVLNKQDYTYTIENRTTQIEYTLFYGNGKESRAVKPVSLDRVYDINDPSWLSNSIYEYKHDFDLSDYNGQSVMLLAVGLDKNGKSVDGSEETLFIQVGETNQAKPPVSLPDDKDNPNTGDKSAPFSIILLLSASVFVISKKR